MEELNRRYTLEGGRELATSFGHCGFWFLLPLPGFPVVSSLLYSHSCCWDAALSSLTSPNQCRVSRYSDLLLTGFELQQRSQSEWKALCDTRKESRPLFSSWCSVLWRAGGVAVKWVSPPPTHLSPCTSPPASLLTLPRPWNAVVDTPAHSLVVRTQGAAAQDWWMGARRTC